MSATTIDIILEPSADEGDFKSIDMQQGFENVLAGIREAGVRADAHSYSEKSADGGSWLIGEFIVPLLSASSAIWLVVGAWVQSKNGRKVRLKFGDIEAEATTIAEIQRLVETAERMKKDESQTWAKPRPNQKLTRPF